MRISAESITHAKKGKPREIPEAAGRYFLEYRRHQDRNCPSGQTCQVLAKAGSALGFLRGFLCGGSGIVALAFRRLAVCGWSLRGCGVAIAVSVAPVGSVSFRLRSRRRWRRTAPAVFFLEENFGEPETASGQLAGLIVREKLHAFLAHFCQIDVPGLLADLVHGNAGAFLCLAALAVRLAALLLLLAADALLFPAGLLLLAADTFLLAAGLLCLAALLLLLTALLRLRILVAALLLRLALPLAVAIGGGRSGTIRGGLSLAGGYGGLGGFLSCRRGIFRSGSFGKLLDDLRREVSC